MLSLVWPEPVPLPLGDTTVLVSQYQLRDLAALERFGGGGVAGWWRDLADAEAIEDAPARQARLRAVYDAAERGLPWFGSDAVSAVLEGPYGRLETCYLSLVKAAPALTRADVVALAAEATPEQWKMFDRVAWALDPLDEAARVIDAEIGVTFAGPPPPSDLWERLVGRLVRKGWTFDALGALYLSQWDTLTRGGAKRTHPYAEPEKPPKGWTWKRLETQVNAPRRAFWATSPGQDPSGSP